MDFIPALIRNDLKMLGDLICEIDFRGSKRAEVEHNTFEIYHHMSRLRESGLEFVGMSSVGPSIAVITEKGQEGVDDAKDQANAKAAQLIADAEKKGDELIAEAQQQADALVAEAQKQATAIRDEANKQAKKLEDDAKGNIVKEKTAKIAADKLRSEADKKADQLVAEASNKGNSLVDQARQQKVQLVE